MFKFWWLHKFQTIPTTKLSYLTDDVAVCRAHLVEVPVLFLSQLSPLLSGPNPRLGNVARMLGRHHCWKMHAGLNCLNLYGLRGHYFLGGRFLCRWPRTGSPAPASPWRARCLGSPSWTNRVPFQSLSTPLSPTTSIPKNANNNLFNEFLIFLKAWKCVECN